MTDDDSQVIGLVQAMFRELSEDLRAAREEAKSDHNYQLKKLQELDAKVTKADVKVTEALRRQDLHDKWHGDNDIAIAQRLDGLAGVKHDEAVRSDAVAEYKKRFAWLTSLGLDAVKAVALMCVGAGLGWALNAVFG